LALIGVWAALAIVAIAKDFTVAMPVTIGLCAIAVYVVAADAIIRLLKPVRA
jgi:phosphatidylcholine synthase